MENKIVYEEEKMIENEKTEEKEIHIKEQPVYKNAKENLYDHINISVKALDIFIGVAFTLLVIILLYAIISSKA